MAEPAGNFDAWLGRTETRGDTIDPKPALGLAALLDWPDSPVVSETPGAPLPPLWHWCYFLETARQSEIAADGHARRGGFLPPIDLPRRMWAGGRFRFHHPLRIGESVIRRSRIESIEQKQGRSGPLAFVRVAHEYESPAGLAFSEAQDIVYRGAEPVAGATGQAARKTAANDLEADFQRETQAGAVMLFRYSALTFNAHRIHYDRDYARDIEGYPGLVVHGPLLATLLLDELLRQYPHRELREFSFRALAPVFDTDPLRLCGTRPGAGGECALWVANSAGSTCLRGEAKLPPPP
ncbi:MAG: MaoC family dehydratase N-terminal domain-containing protein [Gammaproteobacteria bacterium]|nr:MaoC family dehydratase N-terminal domain-containing protein [Gammaproteobacteria bacterium]